MGLISLAFIPLLSIHKIHHVLQLKEIGRVGLNNAVFLRLYVRREWSLSFEESIALLEEQT